MERNDRLIRKKIYKYMLTGVMTTVALQLGNVVDAMIVGNLIGSIGNSAVTAGIPFVYILQAAAILMGTGGAVTIAVLLGKREVQKAGKVMGFSVIFCIAYPLIFTIATPFSVPAFISLTGAEGQLADMIHSITTVYSLGMPAVSFVLCMAYLITVDNHPGLAAKMNIVANVVNLGLDYILVKYTSLGITGAALSTVLGYVVAGLIFIPGYFRSRERMVKPLYKGALREGKLIRLTMKNGFPNIVSLVMTVVSMFIINSAVLRTLGAERIIASPVAVGSGTVRCAHGLLPVPAPATANLLRGIPSYAGDVTGELCTPTGAALLRRYAAEFGAMPAMVPTAVGYGFGTKEFPDRPNCVRAILGEACATGECGGQAPGPQPETIFELACNLDDMTPEDVGFAMEKLYEAGAVEVFTTAVGMKKNRPGVLLTALCRPERRDAVIKAMLTHTATLGVREQQLARYALARSVETVETAFGAVRRKTARGFGVERRKWEFDDLAAIAAQRGMTIGEVRPVLDSEASGS